MHTPGFVAVVLAAFVVAPVIAFLPRAPIPGAAANRLCSRRVAETLYILLAYVIFAGLFMRLRMGPVVGLLVAGAAKRDPLARIARRRVTPALPASFLWLHPAALCLCDRTAAGDLPLGDAGR